jgi:hypothetical protein
VEIVDLHRGHEQFPGLEEELAVLRDLLDPGEGLEQALVVAEVPDRADDRAV